MLYVNNFNWEKSNTDTFQAVSREFNDFRAGKKNCFYISSMFEGRGLKKKQNSITKEEKCKCKNDSVSLSLS